MSGKLQGQWIATSKDPSKTKKDQWLSDVSKGQTLEQLKEEMTQAGEDINMFNYKDPVVMPEIVESDNIAIYIKAIFAILCHEKFGRSEQGQMIIKEALKNLRMGSDIFQTKQRSAPDREEADS